MISSILNIVGGLFSIVGQWMKDRASPQNVAARTKEQDQENNDAFRTALKEKDLEKTRTDLADQ